MRVPSLVAAFTILAAACGAGSGSSGDASGDGRGRAVGQAEASPTSDVPSALDNPLDESLPTPLVDPAELRSGGPPPDGIPAIDEPRFLDTQHVDFLDDDEPVLAMDVDGDARAYPIQIMTWHEIVNDTVGGVPVAVTYCPLCNTAIAYDRRVGDRVLDFGTSGMLYNSALVMYDRQTESLWTHFTGEAIVGHLVGTELELLPVQTVAWRDWREAHPDGLVLSRDTGHDRDYGRNPYPGYDDVDDPPFLYDGPVDGRYPAKTRLVGIREAGEAVGIVLDHLLDERVIEVEVAERPLVAWVVSGTASGLDAPRVADGRDVGATGVFDRRVDGQTLTFEVVDDATFRDVETGSTWNVLGEALSGPLTGRSLDAVEHVDTLWFAWGAYVPDSNFIDR
jgi:hypothetical protein